mmetsp:Transcript_2028/g.6082  ORF Transcript_2028/g.6082 Transcript_2028/m.6082 type:complete len:237 (-) Transcript_2028:1869-2579(-)
MRRHTRRQGDAAPLYVEQLRAAATTRLLGRHHRDRTPREEVHKLAATRLAPNPVAVALLQRTPRATAWTGGHVLRTRPERNRQRAAPRGTVEAPKRAGRQRQRVVVCIGGWLVETLWTEVVLGLSLRVDQLQGLELTQRAAVTGPRELADRRQQQHVTAGAAHDCPTPGRAVALLRAPGPPARSVRSVLPEVHRPSTRATHGERPAHSSPRRRIHPRKVPRKHVIKARDSLLQLHK